jgi:hypothetical protein
VTGIIVLPGDVVTVLEVLANGDSGALWPDDSGDRGGGSGDSEGSGENGDS